MILGLRERGYKEGFKAAKEAKDSGKSIKAILKFESNDKEIAKNLMEELKEYNVRWDTCFRLAVKYSFGYDNGVIDAVYNI